MKEMNFTPMRIIRLLVVAALICLSSLSAFAQDTIPPSKVALIKEFLEVTGAKKQANDSSTMMMNLQLDETDRMLAAMIDSDKTMSPEYKAAMKNTIKGSNARTRERLTKFFTENLDMGALLEEVAAPIYHKYFIEDDLKAINEFYRSDAGKKMVTSSTAMMGEMVVALMAKMTPKMTEFMQKAMEQEMEMLRKETKVN
jgi:hypothetical protein